MSRIHGVYSVGRVKSSKGCHTWRHKGNIRGSAVHLGVVKDSELVVVGVPVELVDNSVLEPRKQGRAVNRGPANMKQNLILKAVKFKITIIYQLSMLLQYGLMMMMASN